LRCDRGFERGLARERVGERRLRRGQLGGRRIQLGAHAREVSGVGRAFGGDALFVLDDLVEDLTA
jgi:hypothetical protein